MEATPNGSDRTGADVVESSLQSGARCLPLASAANGEIALIARALKDHIDSQEPDLCGPVAMLSRGMLARILQLSDVLDECLVNGNDWSDEEIRSQVLNPHR